MNPLVKTKNLRNLHRIRRHLSCFQYSQENFKGIHRGCGPFQENFLKNNRLSDSSPMQSQSFNSVCFNLDFFCRLGNFLRENDAHQGIVFSFYFFVLFLGTSAGSCKSFLRVYSFTPPPPHIHTLIYI